jgi:chorismate mutase/prephenate dehydratase
MAEASNNESGELSSLRRRIDDLDKQIVDLLNERAKVVVDVGKTKVTNGTPVYAPDREQAVLRRIAEINQGPLPPKTLQAIYRELMSGSFALEKPLRIGFLGPLGSFSHLAAVRKFGSSVEYRPLADIRAVFEEVQRGHCDLGMVPIENSLGGGVIESMDCFIDSSVHTCAEVMVEIHHNLLANCPPEEIKSRASPRSSPSAATGSRRASMRLSWCRSPAPAAPRRWPLASMGWPRSVRHWRRSFTA